MRRLFLAWASGVLVCLTLPFVWPWRPGVEALSSGAHEPLVLIALIPLLWAAVDVRPGRAFSLGWFSGFVAFVGILHWTPVATTVFGGLSWWVSLLLLCALAAWCGLWWGAAVSVTVWFRRALGAPAWLVLPAAWVLAEVARGTLLTGFPWGHLGYTLSRTPALSQVAALGGVDLVAALIATVNGAAFEALRAWTRRSGRVSGGVWAGLALSLVALTASLGWGVINETANERVTRDARTVSFGLIQGNVDQRIKNDRGYHANAIAEAHVRPTLEALREGADLIVWPESAMPRRVPFDIADLSVVPGLEPLVGGWDAAILLTGDTGRYTNGALTLTNSVFLVDSRLRVGGRYDKVRLVPFAEYVPMRALIPLPRLLPGGGRFVPGGPPRPIAAPLERAGPPALLGVSVCYDSVFPGVARELTRSGAEVLVLATNDAWYGRSGASFQFLRISAMRSVETGRWTARAANTGVSGFIDPSGRVLGATGLGLSEARGRSIGPDDLLEPELVMGDVPLLSRRTPYVLIGDWPRLAAAALLLSLVGLSLRRRR